ncbi:hypothetical protein [Yoonia sp. 208BN28-4]|uniref:hypothetical protein n=1 Tax=Yoonia sp. 208BN28-4 TaxID=3126505 RepID=UPI00309F7426
MLKVSTVFAAIAVVGLSACSGINTNGERALVGAGIGCVAGEAIAGSNCTEGALAGGLAGALARDVTGR